MCNCIYFSLHAIVSDTSRAKLVCVCGAGCLDGPVRGFIINFKKKRSVFILFIFVFWFVSIYFLNSKVLDYFKKKNDTRFTQGSAHVFE